jgi:cyclophilin family peptidyl-prolyl cis-trans isomerase
MPKRCQASNQVDTIAARKFYSILEGSMIVFRLVSLLLLVDVVTGFSAQEMFNAGAKMSDMNRRDVIQSTIFSTAASILTVSSVNVRPSSASYIDPTTDMPKITKRVYLDVQMASEETPHRLVIGLFGELTPKLSENFIKLCEGTDSNYSYAGSTFYRVISNMTVQGGAIGDASGKTGKSSFAGGEPFEPDNFSVKHTTKGLVSAVRGIGGSVDSRFFISTSDDGGWADDRYAVFGIVEQGMDFVEKLDKVEVKPPQNKPKIAVNIIGSGVL